MRSTWAFSQNERLWGSLLWWNKKSENERLIEEKDMEINWEYPLYTETDEKKREYGRGRVGEEMEEADMSKRRCDTDWDIYGI